MTLTEFLLARIAEDEHLARAAEHNDGPATLQWRVNGRRHLSFDNGSGEDYIAVRCGDWDRILVARDAVGDGPTLSAHIARHDPARVLAECEAKRRIVELHANGYPGLDYCTTCWYDHDAAAWPCDTLKALALPYADHPDYRDEWKP